MRVLLCYCVSNRQDLAAAQLGLDLGLSAAAVADSEVSVDLV